jgi:S1-C subfamily serine protease
MSIFLLTSSLFAQDFIDVQARYGNTLQTGADSVLAMGKRTSKEIFESTLKNPSPYNFNLQKVKKKKLSNAEVFETASKATVLVSNAHLCSKCSQNHLSPPATGYIISEDGLVATNYHVAQAYLSMFENKEDTPLGVVVQLHDGRTYLVKDIVGSSEMDDLAILRLDIGNEKLPYLTLSKGAKVGDEVYMLGHPSGLMYYFTKGMVNAKYHTPISLEEHQKSGFIPYQMLISADYAAGASGGPILDVFGNVVGTVSSTGAITHPTGGHQMVIKFTVPVERLWEIVNKKS